MSVAVDFREVAKRSKAEAARIGGNDAALRRDELGLHAGKPRQRFIAADRIERGQAVIDQDRKPHLVVSRVRGMGSERGADASPRNRLSGMTINCYFLTMPKSLTIALFAYDGFQLLDVTGPAAVFAAANRELERNVYTVEVLSPSGGAVTSDSGVTLQTRAMARLPRGASTPC